MTTNLSGCVIPNGNGELLLIHRFNDGLQQWELPGGKVEEESGEMPPEAATRELQEELGIEVAVVRKLDEAPFHQRGQDYNYIWYLAKITRGTPRLKESGHDRFGYFSMQQLQEMDDISPNLQNLIKKIIIGEVKL